MFLLNLIYFYPLGFVHVPLNLDNSNIFLVFLRFPVIQRRLKIIFFSVCQSAKSTGQPCYRIFSVNEFEAFQNYPENRIEFLNRDKFPSLAEFGAKIRSQSKIGDIDSAIEAIFRFRSRPHSQFESRMIFANHLFRFNPDVQKLNTQFIADVFRGCCRHFRR